jgi:hypothetical protein
MRKDMNKVLTTRPRTGGKAAKLRKIYEQKATPKEVRYFKGVKVDLRPKRESMRKRYHVDGDPKYFSDHIQPLFRYLEAQVGRRWNDVWSEICQVLKGTSLQAQHVKGHVKQYINGIPHSGETFFRAEDWFQGSRPGDLYVNEDGILCQTPRKKLRVRREFHYYRESEQIEYHKIDGFWYRVDIEAEHYDEEYQFLGKVRTFPRVRYSVKRKQIVSKKNVRRLDLENRFEATPPRANLS